MRLRAATRSACFVRPDTTLPFMAMPDASMRLVNGGRAAPRASLSGTEYNLRAFSRFAGFGDVVCRSFTSRDYSRIDDKAGSGHRGFLCRPTSTIRGRGLTGVSSRGIRFRSALFHEYLMGQPSPTCTTTERRAAP